MRSDARRPSEIRLDRFVEQLDAHLREEAATIRRFALPESFHRLVRAVKVRALVLLQGGAMALTALAVLVAVGMAPAVTSPISASTSTPLAAPQVVPESALMQSPDRVTLAAGTVPEVPGESRGLIR